MRKPKKSNEGFKQENYSKVAYVIGAMRDLPLYDWDVIAVEIINIVSDWENYIDIRNTGEEGYIMEYAERVLTEKYLK